MIQTSECAQVRGKSLKAEGGGGGGGEEEEEQEEERAQDI
jgi:hypothetical protein